MGTSELGNASATSEGESEEREGEGPDEFIMVLKMAKELGHWKEGAAYGNSFLLCGAFFWAAFRIRNGGTRV